MAFPSSAGILTAVTPRTLTSRELNRALLARQLLLERSAAGLPAALEALAGIQAQYAPSMYVGLWSRLDGLARADLTGALETRAVVQATLLRGTIHLVSPGDFWPFAFATRDARRTVWLRSRAGAPTPRAMTAAARTLRAALEGGRSLHRRDVEALLGKLRAGGVGLWLDLVRVPPSGTWEHRRADLYGLAEEWVGPGELDRDPVEHLVRRYLRGFGPASRRDVASFTGLPIGTLKPVLERIELARYAGEGGEELLDLPGGILPDAGAAAPVRFLPTWDAILLAHARRTGVLPERHRPAIFTSKNPHSLPTFLVDGIVAGTWRHEQGTIRLEPFAPLASAAREQLEAEAERLAAFHA